MKLPYPHFLLKNIKIQKISLSNFMLYFKLDTIIMKEESDCR